MGLKSRNVEVFACQIVSDSVDDIMNRVYLLIVVFAVAGTVAVMAGCSSDECQTDDDCPGEARCVSGGGAMSSNNECVGSESSGNSENFGNVGESDAGPIDDAEDGNGGEVPTACDGVDCSGNGHCEVSGGTAVCNCDAGYVASGLDCVADTCDGVTCSGHGTCVSTPGNVYCECDEGFVEGSGLTCEDPCAGVNCSGLGSCEVGFTGEPRCECDDGYAQDGTLDCVDNCAGVDCSGHGQCQTQSNGTAYCDCDPNYMPTSGGLDCEEISDEPCEDIDCSGHGTCVFDNGSISCDCDSGYFEGIGLTCEDPCEGETCSGNGTCVPQAGGNSYCDCDAGYVEGAGMTCNDICDGIDCSGMGECEVTSNDEPVCNCDDGFAQQGDLDCRDNCEGQTCSGNGQCETETDGTAYCDCDSGYQSASGLSCEEIPPEPCEDVDCSGFGTCDDSSGEAVCDCETNYVDPGTAECVHRCDNGELEYCDFWKVEGTSNIQWEGYRLSIPSSELPANAETGADAPSGPIQAGFSVTQQDWGFVLTPDHFYKFDLSDIDGAPYWIESRPLSDLDGSLASTPEILGAYNIPDAFPTGPSAPEDASDGVTIMGYDSTEPVESQMRIWAVGYHHASQDFIVDEESLIDHGHDAWIGKENAPDTGDIRALWLDVAADTEPGLSWVEADMNNYCADPNSSQAIIYSGILTKQDLRGSEMGACPADTFISPMAYSAFPPFSTADAPTIDASVGATIFHEGALYLFRENPL